MKSISELRPSRHLIDDNFGGYFLSLTSIPTYSVTLKDVATSDFILKHLLKCNVSGTDPYYSSEGVMNNKILAKKEADAKYPRKIDQVFPSDEQYSYIHAKLFSLHNHLFHDPWSKDGLFFIDKNWKIHMVLLNPNTDTLDKIIEVWEMPSNHSRRPGHYPTSMIFPTCDLVVLTDGAGTLHVVSKLTNIWQAKYGEEVIGKETPFLIVDCRCEVNDSRRTLHILLLHLESTLDDSSSDSVEQMRTVTYLEWITLVEELSGSWSLHCIRQLKGKSLPDYIAFEPGCKSIYIISEHPFSFISDTNNPVISEKEKEDEMKKKNTIYLWQQNAEEIKVWLNLEDGVSKKDVKVNVKDQDFVINCKDKTILKGILHQNIDNDLTTWTFEEKRLNIVLQKLEQGLMWREFLRDNCDGEEILDEIIVQEVHERLSHLCSDKEVRDSEVIGSTPAFNMEQLEDCDNYGESQVLSRIDGTTHEITHQYTLAGHQWLFIAKLNPANAPAMCLRHDVHGCLWQPEPFLQESDSWKCTHLCTFPAFGYVHASKQNRKFSLCSTDSSFTVICETNNHIYIYYKDTTSDLRNRRSGISEREKVGKLHCIKMESPYSVLGAVSFGSNLFILIKNKLYQYEITVS